MVGKTISHYKILEKLGEGGMGVVYKAEDTKLKRYVVLKFLAPEFTRDPEARERFVREAQAASALEHPNVCNIHEIDEIATEGRNQMFICMAYYEGETLKEKIENGPLELEKAIDIAMQVVRGLSSAHEAGITHRDIKPSNIMILDRGDVKILDFGLAKLSRRTKLTETGTTLGTLDYMSPEQAQGAEVDHRSDIFSLGVVLYEMVTAKKPFEQDIDQLVVYSILNENPEPITALRSGVPLELERVVNKSMRKDRDERYQHMDELLVDLKALELRKQVKDTIQARRSHVKRRFIVVGAFLALLLFLLVAKFLWFPQSSAPPDKGTVAVMYFENLSKDPTLDWLERGVSSLLTTSLSHSKALNVIHTQYLFDIIPSKTKGAIDKSAVDLARRTNIATLISGDIIKSGSTLRINAQVVETMNGQVVLAPHADGRDDDDIFSMVAQLSSIIQPQLEVKAAGAQFDEKWLQSVTTNSVAAYRHFVEATSEFIQSDWQKAKQLYQKAVSIDSTFGLAYVWLATVDFILRNDKAIIGSYQRATSLRQKMSQNETIMLDIFKAELKEDYQTQIALTEKFLQFDPRNNLMKFVLGRGYYKAKQYEKAIKVLGQLSNDRWKHDYTYYYLGRTYGELKRIDEEIKAYQTGLKIVPEFTAFSALVSAAYFRQGDSLRAEQHFKEFLSETEKKRENAGEQYLEAGESYKRAGMYNHAFFCLKESILQNPQNPHPYYWSGEAYEDLGNVAEAIDFYTKYIELQKTGFHVPEVKRRLTNLKSETRSKTDRTSPDEKLR